MCTIAMYVHDMHVCAQNACMCTVYMYVCAQYACMYVRNIHVCAQYTFIYVYVYVHNNSKEQLTLHM